LFILLTQLKRELDEEHVQKLSLEREVKDLRTLVTKQQGNILKLEMQTNDTTTKLQEQEKDNEELKKVLDEKDEENKEYKKKHDGYFKQLNELISQLEGKKGEIRTYQREIDELKDKHRVSTRLRSTPGKLNPWTGDNTSRKEIRPLFALVKLAPPLHKHYLYPNKSIQ
jgi:chromosome segregation ATPase